MAKKKTGAVITETSNKKLNLLDKWFDDIAFDIEEFRQPESDKLENDVAYIARRALSAYIDIMEENKQSAKMIADELAILMQHVFVDFYEDEKRRKEVIQAFVSCAHILTEGGFDGEL